MPPMSDSRPEKNGTLQHFWDSGYAAGVASLQDEVAGWREHAEHLEDAQNAANQALIRYKAVVVAAWEFRRWLKAPPAHTNRGPGLDYADRADALDAALAALEEEL